MSEEENETMREEVRIAAQNEICQQIVRASKEYGDGYITRTVFLSAIREADDMNSRLMGLE